MNELNPPETALDAMRDYFQANHRDLEALRAAGNAHDQRINELLLLCQIHLFEFY